MTMETVVVVVNGRAWECLLAQSLAELSTGLSGVASIDPNTGMLFDLGTDMSSIGIYTDELLFNVDIVYVNSEQGVVGISLNVAPGDEEEFEAGVGEPGARYFMEVNAGEANDVGVGDSVTITRPARAGIVLPTGLVMTGLVAAGVAGVVAKVVKEKM